MPRSQPWGAIVVVLVVALLLLAAAAFGSSKPRMRLLVVGDSLAVGTGHHLVRLARRSGAEVAAVEAKEGTRCDQWSSLVQGPLARFRPTLVLVVLGTNDAAMADPMVNAGHVRGIASAVRAAGARLVWVGMPSLPDRLKTDAVRSMILAASVDYFDSRWVAFDRAADGIHATPDGYKTWARAIWSYVEQR